jgi:hypothetical protein
MMVCRIVVALMAAGLSSGCLVLSLHPFFEEDAIVFEEQLIGTWESIENAATLHIERAEWRSYRIRYEQGAETTELAGYLTRIGSERFLDLAPEHGEAHTEFLIPAHGLFRIEVDGDALRVAPLNHDWFHAMMHDPRPPRGLRLTVDERDHVLLTSLTKELRTWLAQWSNHPDVFSPAETLRRRKAAG